jgi:DNA invertase Pin-like site-specific DNA recombinase
MNTAGYVRVSAQRQSQAQTLDQQLARRRAHLAAQGEARQSAQSFREAGDSGASLKRPGRAHLRDALKDRCVDHSRVTTPERRARNSVHPMGRLEALAHLGGPGEFRERAMRQDPHDPWLVQIRSVVAASERTRRAERRRRGRPMKRRAGLLLPWTTTIRPRARSSRRCARAIWKGPRPCAGWASLGFSWDCPHRGDGPAGVPPPYGGY